MTLLEFQARFVSALRKDPPQLVDGILDAEFGGWLLKYFTAEELHVFREFEDRRGAAAADEVVLQCFALAGLTARRKR